MKKAFFIIDMPVSCGRCDLQQFGICHAAKISIAGTPKDLKRRPEWCPLRELPEKKERLVATNDYDGGYSHGFTHGYNACIDELTKEG